MLSSKLGKHHIDDHDERRLSERHFMKNILAGEGRKRQKPSRRCFVCSKLLGCKKKRTLFWCEECRELAGRISYLLNTVNYFLSAQIVTVGREWMYEM